MDGAAVWERGALLNFRIAGVKKRFGVKLFRMSEMWFVIAFDLLVDAQAARNKSSIRIEILHDGAACVAKI
jgi:hypothetical protein